MKHRNLYNARKMRRQRTLERCAKMRAAKERKRLAHAEVAVFSEIGRAVFSGPLFGDHEVVIVGRSDAENMAEIMVDGRITCVKTQRGARALLMRRTARGILPR